MEAIDDDDDLLRRVIVSQHVNPDGTVNSGAFKDRKGKPDPAISVSLARITSPQRCLELGGIPGLAVAALKAYVPRSLGLQVVPDPDEKDPGHCLILGATTKQHCRERANAAQVMFPAPR